jgi:transcriptional regulator with XRE-family HTH domain
MGRICQLVRIDVQRFLDAVAASAKELGLSPHRLALNAGVAKNTFNNMRRRDTSPSAAAMLSLAMAAGLDPRHFLQDTRRCELPPEQDPQPRESTELEGMAVMAYIRETLFGVNIPTGPRTA